ncbi:hypothetical protein [Aquiflexum sp.]|uniref:hypothetical protein n=1 Tax=Aquiflexum sp. TaxID=1872584 RepID=UPI003593B090
MVERGELKLSLIQSRTPEVMSCFISPEISDEQFIPEHIFFFLVKGFGVGYNGTRNITSNPLTIAFSEKTIWPGMLSYDLKLK